jgi:type IV secretory pathway VirB10-like protein
MNKAQLLILLLIIALIFYLNEDKTNHSTNHHPPKPQAIINQPVRPEPPQSTVNSSPAKFKFGLNPPHSQLDEPPKANEPTKPPSIPPEPTDKPLKAKTPTSDFLSELTPQEQSQRQEQELSDYHFILNNKTLYD